MSSQMLEDRQSIGEVHNKEKSFSAKLDGRLVFLIKMATIDTGLTAQLLIKALLTGFAAAYDERVSGPPSEEPLIVQFPWFPLGADLRAYRDEYQRSVDQWLQEIVDRGYSTSRRLHFQAHESGEYEAGGAHTGESLSSLLELGASDANPEEGRALGREWALKEENLPHLRQLVTLYDQISPELYPSFIDGVREVISAFESWNDQQRS